MKKYKVGKYVVTAKDAVQAARIVSKIDSKKYVIFKQNGVYKMTTEENYARPIQNAREITTFNNMNSKDEIVEYVKKYLGGMTGIRFVDSMNDSYTVADEASQLQTVNALIEDEKAAVEAYNVAIENLRGKIPEESLQAIIAIRDDENRHIENLQAVVNGTVTEKNLEDSMMHDEEFIISKNGVPLAFWHPNDLANSSGSLQNIIKFSNNSYMTFSNEGEAKDMLSTIKRDILDPSNVERWSKSYPATKEKLLKLLNNLKVTKIKDATIW